MAPMTNDDRTPRDSAQSQSLGTGELATAPAYDPAKVIKVVLDLDGNLLDVEFPAGAEEALGCDTELKTVLATIQYGTSICNPPCPAGKTCRCVKKGGVIKCRCL